MWIGGTIVLMLSLDKIAITGATGFIGRHLLRELIANECYPIVLTRGFVPQSLSTESNGRLRWLQADLKDQDSLSKILLAERPSILIHLAGTRGRAGEVSPALACAESNTCDTVRLLNAACGAGVRRVIIMGSAAEYGSQPGPLHEGLASAPVSPYGISKAAMTDFAKSLYSASGCPVVILRPFTVYGPGQPGDMFVSEAVEHAVANQPFHMSNGYHRQDLVFVDDVVQALIAAAYAPRIEGLVINIGSGNARRLRDIAHMIWRLSESPAPLLIGSRAAPTEDAHDTSADINLARDLLGWEPKTDLETGLRSMIAWTRQQHLELSKPRGGSERADLNLPR